MASSVSRPTCWPGGFGRGCTRLGAAWTRSRSPAACPAPECIAEEELADCARTVIEREGKSLLSYGPSAGYTPLRALIAQWFGVHPGRVLLTNGSLQGLWLLAKRFARGNNVVVEWPTYDRALKVLLGSGASLLAAVVDDDGMNIDDLDQQLMGQSKPAFVYTIPTFQNPTGPHAARPTAAGRWSQVLGRRQIMIVEDDPYAPDPVRGRGAAGDLRLLRQDLDLHVVVLEDDRARPARGLDDPARGRSPRSWPRRPRRRTSRRRCSARRSCTSSSRAAASSRTSGG